MFLSVGCNNHRYGLQQGSTIPVPLVWSWYDHTCGSGTQFQPVCSSSSKFYFQQNTTMEQLLLCTRCCWILISASSMSLQCQSEMKMQAFVLFFCVHTADFTIWSYPFIYNVRFVFWHITSTRFMVCIDYQGWPLLDKMISEWIWDFISDKCEVLLYYEPHIPTDESKHLI